MTTRRQGKAARHASEAERAAARDTLWRAGVLTWKLWPQQRRIYETIKGLPRSVPTVVILCARQFGKSVLGVLCALEDCLQNPDVVVLIVAPTIKQARAIVRPRAKLLTRDAPAGLIRHVKSEDTWYFANGSELRLAGYDTGAASQRGKTLHKIYLEEIGVDSDPDKYNDFIRSDLGPALTHSKHAQIFYLTTPPKVPDHPFLSETVPEAERAGAYFKFTIDDNEKLTPEQYAKCVKISGGKHTTEFRREYMCEVVRDGSLVLVPEFDEKIHVREFDLPEYCRMWIGGDTGGVQDRTVLLLLAFDFDNAKILVTDEVEHPPETSSGIYVAQALVMEAAHTTKVRKLSSRWVDAPGQLQIDLMAIHKYASMLPRKDELDATVNQVRAAFSRLEVVVHPRCKLTVVTLRSGTFNDRRTDLARTSTLGHMDAFMALAYGIRHADRTNPYPNLHGLHDESHHIPSSVRRKKSHEGLANAFRPTSR